MNGKIGSELRAQELGDSGIYINKEKVREKAEEWRKKPQEDKGKDLIRIGTIGLIGGVVLISLGKILTNKSEKNLYNTTKSSK